MPYSQKREGIWDHEALVCWVQHSLVSSDESAQKGKGSSLEAALRSGLRSGCISGSECNQQGSRQARDPGNLSCLEGERLTLEGPPSRGVQEGKAGMRN